MMEKVINEIMNKKIGDVIVNASLAKYTTYKVGGIARAVVYPKDTLKLVELMEIIKEYDVKHFILGNGSNVLFSDNVYEGIIIKLDNFDNIEFFDQKIKVGAGYSLIKLANEAMKRGLAGLEFASGIPGTIGGAIFMNAGAYNSDMSKIVKSVTVLTPDLKVINLRNKEMLFGYRESFLQHNRGFICLGAILKLKHGDRDILEEVMKDRKLKRKRTQPLEYPSAGSVFRNPTDNYAGKLIEDCNLKGYEIGGAQVSRKHANFIINKGDASAKDVKDLIDYVHDEVKNKKGIDLKIEQEFVNWEQ